MSEGRLIAGKYQLLRRIAQGGMAEVYLAKQTGLEGFEKLVVIKRILPHLVENDEFVRMFLDEARTAADLRHPNVVQIFEIGEDQGTYYIAMEFLHGQDVRKVLRRQAEKGARVPPAHALQIIIDAATGLDHAHKKTDLAGRPLNIIHRDISPQNIIVTYDGTTKIVDFGIAKAASQSVETRSGVLKGKYSYMSPEQASGGVLDQRTDQFALGIVLYELTTMTRLFKRENEIMTLHAIIECDFKPPIELNPNYPPELNDIVMTALAQDREDRFRDCRALAEALEEFMADARILHSPTRLATYMQDLFKDDLAKEKALGMPVIDQPEESGIEHLVATRGGRRNTATPPRSNSGVLAAPELQNAGTQVTSSQIVEAVTSPSRRQARLPAPAPSAESDATRVTAPSAAPPPRGGKGGLIAGIVGALLLVGGGGGFLLMQPSYNTLTVRSDPPKARVVFDGTEQAEETPLIIRDLEVGTSHALRVEFPGYAPLVRTVEIKDGKPNEVLVELKKEGPSALIRLRTTPPGARVYFDSRPLEGETPLELPPMPLDADGHVVTFTLEGYLDETRRFTLKEGVQDISVTLSEAKEGMALLNITSVPPNAAITVGGKPVGNTPLTRVPVAGGRSHTVTARLAGYSTQERLVDVAEDGTLDVAFELDKETAETGFLSLDTNPDTTVSTDKGRMLGKTPLKRVKVPAGTLGLRLVNQAKGIDYSERIKIEQDREVKRTITIPKGKLRVVVKPWADVFLDGVKLGQTPFPAKEVYVGRHELRLVNAKLGKDERRTITVEPGDRNRVKVEW